MGVKIDWDRLLADGRDKFDLGPEFVYLLKEIRDGEGDFWHRVDSAYDALGVVISALKEAYDEADDLLEQDKKVDALAQYIDDLVDTGFFLDAIDGGIIRSVLKAAVTAIKKQLHGEE